jgi:transcription elongation GreA/GreB family factor
VIWVKLARMTFDRKPASLDGDELLRTLREAGVEEGLIEQVAATLELAPAVEDRVDGGAGIGSIVTVQDRRGGTTEYELVARSAPEPRRQQSALGSPTSTALLGARPGDYVRVTLPNGRQRRVRVTGVTPAPAGQLAYGAAAA